MSRITRRNFINGTLVAVGGAMVPARASSQAAIASLDTDYYPPALTGLRGSQPGSNDHAHRIAWAGGAAWPPVTELAETYDLVVVGAGISGLAAARFYQQTHGEAKRILILDNHDDFGGHARRNEHTFDGNTRISYGGSQTLVEPKHADAIVLKLFEDIGIDLNRFETAYDKEFFTRHQLGAVTYFNKEVFGEDKVVRHPYCNYPNYVEGLLGGRISHEEAAQQAPLSARGKEQLLRVLNGGLHLLKLPEEQLQDYTRKHSYFDYLRNNLGVDDPGVLRMARHSGLDWSTASMEMVSIASAKSCGAMGFEPVAVYDEENPYIHHFPDGNTTVARGLVKKLIPGVSKGDNAEELVVARFDYSHLDKPGQPVRLRLNSTVIKVEHADSPENSSEVMVTYIHDGRPYRIRAASVIMACYNMIIPHIVSGLPEDQVAALKLQKKSPVQYTSLGLRNWRAFKDLGIGLAMSPGNMHQAVLMDFPVNMGGYEFTKTPEHPCVIQMICCPYGEFGAPVAEQYRQARFKMLSLQFADYEKEIRSHLSGMLSGAGFDFDQDVESITVNRWGHGYAVGGPGDSIRIGRRRFGRIAIANSDSAGDADAKTAIMMAHRAVNELG